MPDPKAALAATFVEPRGMIRSVVAGAAGMQAAGVAGSVAAQGLVGSPGEEAPLRKGQIGYLAAYAEELVLFRAKRGAFSPKPTDEVLATAPRASVVGATVDKGRLAGRLTITFAQGTAWEFDVPKVHLGRANEVATQLV